MFTGTGCILQIMFNIRQYFIEDPATGAVRFTSKGTEFFRDRFAKAGIDIRTIRTLTQFYDAHQKYLAGEYAVAAINNKNPAIDNLFADFAPYKEGVRLRDN